MSGLAKVVLTDYVWDSLEVEKKTPCQSHRKEKSIADAKTLSGFLQRSADFLFVSLSPTLPFTKQRKRDKRQ